MTNSEILVANLSELIDDLLSKGTVCMSQKNLQQICPTKGLNCSISQYHEAFDEALKVVVKKFPNFQIQL